MDRTKLYVFLAGLMLSLFLLAGTIAAMNYSPI
jgi:hypothetical protein